MPTRACPPSSRSSARPARIKVDTKAAETSQVEQIWQGLNRLPRPSLMILDNFPEKSRFSRTSRSADAPTRSSPPAVKTSTMLRSG